MKGIICDGESVNVLSFSGPAGACSFNKAELLSLRISLLEAHGMNMHDGI